MDIKVSGGSVIKGSVICSGSKNAAIPILCASLLSKGKVMLRNVPRISDIMDICQILRYLDCKVIFKGHTLLIDNTNLKYKPLFLDECKKMRGSYYFIGVFLALFSKCEIWLPGGCKIGSRPIDVHLQAFEDLGFKYTIQDNLLTVYKTNVNDSATLSVSKKSVGASINAIFAGLGLSHYEISNGLYEPEGQDVINFLRKIGYNLTYSDGVIQYEKTNLEFRLIKHTVIPDRMEAMTYVAMGLLKGEVTVKRVNTLVLQEPLRILSAAGYNLSFTDTEIHAKKSYGRKMNITTDVYPGFPTDLQSIFGVLCLNTIGKSEIEETIFENRMQIYKDLKDSGVQCEIEGNIATIYGTNKIHSKNYIACDLRHGAALLLLALLGDKESIISNFEYVLRGYDDIINHVKALGGKIIIL
ncbi:MAG: UDP-N-acetylglucosamine 1-carboxyvinyltransferase [Roseburia sp.]|nr:UDP-N-acetylglucosamine 1-carboxyvinyltransferase [Anaeroplasma bactoclasticum]MCM1196872.1 UDP-N-acetylglucosamine 1-carboxyvinyltransferase [Roseburia sp.]MCM1556098.1 UDP-N-acetylglucosamine 1-carboxyvinyltransferase [Anaeroplasma bactoclasticum]